MKYFPYFQLIYGADGSLIRGESRRGRGKGRGGGVSRGVSKFNFFPFKYIFQNVPNRRNLDLR